MKTDIDRDKLGEIIMKINILIKDYPPVLTQDDAIDYLKQLEPIKKYDKVDRIEEYLKGKLKGNHNN